jgi:ribonucleoside-diphosphate reductase alpha chain
MYASPVLSNAEVIRWPVFGADEFDKAGDWLDQNVKTDCLPISCFLSKIPDTRKGLVDTRAEVPWLSDKWCVVGGSGI